MIEITEAQEIAINYALKDYDKQTLLSIQIKEFSSGWENESEPLNDLDPVILAQALFEGYKVSK